MTLLVTPLCCAFTGDPIGYRPSDRWPIPCSLRAGLRSGAT